jgi:hypothetical protein
LWKITRNPQIVISGFSADIRTKCLLNTSPEALSLECCLRWTCIILFRNKGWDHSRWRRPVLAIKTTSGVRRQTSTGFCVAPADQREGRRQFVVHGSWRRETNFAFLKVPSMPFHLWTRCSIDLMKLNQNSVTEYNTQATVEELSFLCNGR